MSMIDFLQKGVAAMAGTLHSYRLTIPSCSSPVDVEDFSGVEGMSQMYHYNILFISQRQRY